MSNVIGIINDPVLDNVVQGYIPGDQDFIGSQLFPPIRVKSRSGEITQVGTEFLRINSKIKVERTGTPEITVSMSKTPVWKCEDDGLKIMVLKKDGEQFNKADWQAGMADARIKYGKMLKSALMIAKEKEVADALTSTSVITNNSTLSGDDQWSDYTSSNPISNFKTARDTIFDAIGREANVAYMGRAVYETLRFHPAMIDKLNVSSDKAKLIGLTPDQLAMVLNVEKVLVGRVRYESAKEGQSSAMANIWGKDFGLLYVNPSPTPEEWEYSAGYEFILDPEGDPVEIGRAHV